MNRVLVTGGTGFVGANLARRLLRDGHEVFLLARAGYKAWRVDGIRRDVRVLAGDLENPEAVSRAVVEARPAWVFHLAAHGAYPSETDVARIVAVNVLGTANLIAACRGVDVEALVHAGSSSEYGFRDAAARETDRLEPNSPYAVAKAAATHLCRLAARERGRRMPTLRLFSAYGPYEEPSRLVPTLIREGLRGSLPVLVNPSVARDFVYVDDVVEAFVAAAERSSREDPGAVYNLGTGVQTTVREAVEVARRMLKIQVEPQWGTMPNRLWDTSVWVADNRKIRAELGWQARHTFEEGFRKTVEWFGRNPQLSTGSEQRTG